jgi:hypothetical protein
LTVSAQATISPHPMKGIGGRALQRASGIFALNQYRPVSTFRK